MIGLAQPAIEDEVRVTGGLCAMVGGHTMLESSGQPTRRGRRGRKDEKGGMGEWGILVPRRIRDHDSHYHWCPTIHCQSR